MDRVRALWRSVLDNWKMVVIPLSSHLIFGFYPIVTRYLQSEPLNLPTLPVLGLASTLDVILVFAFLIARVPRFWEMFFRRQLWLFAVTTGLRAVTNIYAALWTKAVYVALFTLVTPYFVAVMERLILKEKLPPAFFMSLFGTLVGTVFILLGSLFEAQADQGITPLDVLGMAFALMSAFFLAGYMVLVRMTAKQNMHLMQTFGMQLVAMATMPLVLTSVVPTDWSRFATVGWTDWLVLFLGLSIGIYFVGNMCTFYSIRNFGASFNSVFLGIRLMVAAVGGWIILDEAVTPWQWVGAIVVVASLSYFLYRQTRPPASQPAVDAEAVLLESIGDDDSLHSGGEPASQQEEGDESDGLAKEGAPDALPLLDRAQSHDDRDDE